MKLDILAFGVHPDDVELSCAGTLLAAIAEGKKAGIVDLTQGELGTRGTAETRKLKNSRSAKFGVHRGNKPWNFFESKKIFHSCAMHWCSMQYL